MNRRRALLTLGTAAFGGLAGCNDESSEPRQVEMVGLQFEPQRISVGVGATVEWVNESSISHTVTAYEDQLPPGAAYFASGGFDSEQAAQQNAGAGLLAADETYTHTFETAGEHPYYCIPHEGSGMTGVIAVG